MLLKEEKNVRKRESCLNKGTKSLLFAFLSHFIAKHGLVCPLYGHIWSFMAKYRLDWILSSWISSVIDLNSFGDFLVLFKSTMCSQIAPKFSSFWIFYYATIFLQVRKMCLFIPPYKLHKKAWALSLRLTTFFLHWRPRQLMKFRRAEATLEATEAASGPTWIPRWLIHFCEFPGILKSDEEKDFKCTERSM